MEGRSDAELLNRFRNGDDCALDALCERYEQPLFLFLIGILRDHHRAEDALQETFVQALERLEGVDPDHLRGWLFTVAYHQAMLIRRKLASQHRHFPAAEGSPEEVALDQDFDPARQAASREEVRRCLHAVERADHGVDLICVRVDLA